MEKPCEPVCAPSGRDQPYPAIMASFSRYVAEERPKISSPEEAAALMRPMLALQSQEEFHVLLLDSKHRLLRDVPVTVGLVDRAPVHPREVFRTAVRESASRVLLVHNHPSGDPTPSARDIAATRQLVEAGQIMGIEVLDHVVIGRRTAGQTRDWLSFREEKLL